jgi:predicted RNA-binding Zn ribbon-like protein
LPASLTICYPQTVRITPDNIKLWGGALCLDFANTVDWDDDFGYVDPRRTDVLVSGPWAARWARRVGIPGRGRISQAELERLRKLRVVIHRVFSLPTPDARDLETLRQANAEAMEESTLRPSVIERDRSPVAGKDGAIVPAWRGSDERRVRFAVAWDALQLLGEPDRLSRVRRCPGRRCGWLFVNASGRRRWCSMSACGSREKMRRAYARRRRSTARSHLA